MYADIIIIAFLFLVVYKCKICNCMQTDYLDKDRIVSIKGIMALIVLSHHISQSIPTDSRAFHYFDKVGFLAVAVFFFYSGYGLIYNHVHDDGYRKSFLKKRFINILLPYLLATCIYYVFYILIGNKWSISDVFYGFVAGLPIVKNSWFVICIVFVYLFYYIVMNICKNNYKLLIVLMICFEIVWILFCINMHWWPYWYNTGFCIVYGMIYGLYKEQLEQKLIDKSVSFVVISILFILLSVSYFIFTNKLKLFTDLIYKELITVSFCTLIILISRRFRIGNRFLVFLGKISLELYLYQEMFIILFHDALKISNQYILLSAIIISAILFSTIAHFLWARLKIRVI